MFATLTKQASRLSSAVGDGASAAATVATTAAVGASAVLPTGLFDSTKRKEDVDIPLNPEGPIVIRYLTQNDKDTEGAAFALPAECCSPMTPITLKLIKEHFPLPGAFYFRFKMKTAEDCFGGFVFVDMPSDEESVPMFQGGITAKVLRMPDEPGESAFRPGPRVAAPKAAPRAPAAPAAPASLLSENSPPFGKAATQPAPARSVRPSLSPADDLMSLGSVAPAAPPAPAMSAPALDRASLVANREAEKARRISDQAAAHEANVAKEEMMKAQKVTLNHQLGVEMDAWAKTPDGTQFKDIRALLTSVHTVLWKDSGWTPVSMSDVVSKDSNVKKFYRKAILLTHPDKAGDRGAEQQVRADRIFQALNESFKKDSS